MDCSLAILLLAVSFVGVRTLQTIPNFPEPSLPSYPALTGYPFSNPSSGVPFHPTVQHRTYYNLPSSNANSIRYKTGPVTAKYEVPRPPTLPKQSPSTTSTSTTTTQATTMATTTAAPVLDTDEHEIIQFKATFKSARQLLASQLPDESPYKNILASESDDIDQKLEINLARYRFPLFDKNDDKYISVSELGTVVEKLCGKNLTSKQEVEVRRRFASYDTNGDGKLSFNEFLRIPTPLPTLPTIREGLRDNTCRSQLMMAFTIVDMNGNGYVSSAELRRLGKVFIQEDTDEISDLIDSTVAVLDNDDDGQFDFEEFDNALKTVRG